MKRQSNGFTLIEILLVVCIIGILVSVISVGLGIAKTKAQDNAAFTSFKSVSSAAFACLTNGEPLIRLRDPDPAGTSICSIPGAVGSATWPDFSKYGWTNTVRFTFLAPVGFYWCDISSSGPSHPTGVGAYVPGTRGGRAISGEFCIMLKRDTKYIWCTEEGCKKEGF